MSLSWGRGRRGREYVVLAKSSPAVVVDPAALLGVLKDSIGKNCGAGLIGMKS
jgi:hypothetical protein